MSCTNPECVDLARFLQERDREAQALREKNLEMGKRETNALMREQNTHDEVRALRERLEEARGHAQVLLDLSCTDGLYWSWSPTERAAWDWLKSLAASPALVEPVKARCLVRLIGDLYCKLRLNHAGWHDACLPAPVESALPVRDAIEAARCAAGSGQHASCQAVPPSEKE